MRSKFFDNAVVTGQDELTDYDSYIQKVHAKMKVRRSRQQSSPEDIAQVIYKAAVDKGDRLRYLAGGDAGLVVRLRNLLSYGMFNRLIKRLAT